MTENGRWSFEKVGLGYHCWSDEVQTHLRLTRIKRSRDELTGDLAITTNIKGTKSQENGLFHRARFNASSSSARSTLARTLEKRTPQDMDWFDALEALCQGVMEGEETGEPVVEIGNSPARPQGAKFLVEPLVLKGERSLIYGPGGSGKSLISLACGLSVAVGREIIPGIAPAVHGNVLYLDWETEYEEINDRIQAIAAGHKFKPAGMLYRRCQRSLISMAEEIAAKVVEHKIALVIIDSAAYAMGRQSEHSDANESVLQLHEGLRLLGTSCLIIDHVNRIDARSKPGTASPYGSVYKDNAARMNWELRKLRLNGTSKIGLYHHKTNNTPDLPPVGIEMTWSAGAVAFSRTPIDDGTPVEGVDPGTDDTATAIRELLADGGMFMPPLVSTLTTPTRKAETIRRTAYRMLDRGELTKSDRGVLELGSLVPFRQR